MILVQTLFLKLQEKELSVDLSNISKIEFTNTLLSNNNLTNPGNILIPSFERLSILIATRKSKSKYNIYTVNNSLNMHDLSADENKEINYFNLQYSKFASNKTDSSYIYMILIMALAYVLVIIFITYYLVIKVLETEVIDLKTNIYIPLAFFEFCLSTSLLSEGIIYVWEYKYFKFINEYKDIRAKISYKGTGVFILVVNDSIRLIKVSNFRREINRRAVNINNISERNNSNNESISNIPNNEIISDNNELSFSFVYVEQFALKISKL